jgi:hypothetical protein
VNRIAPLALVLASCTTAQPMTIVEHEDAADADLAIAGGFAADDNPNAQHGVVIGPEYGEADNLDVPAPPTTTNAKIADRFAALHHARLSSAHRRAAVKLLEAEVDECAPFTKAERAACPELDASIERVQCHVAYAAAFGETCVATRGAE